jgi:hypothetical protein
VNPFVVKQDTNLFHDDLSLMGTVMRFAATNRRRGTSINAKLKTKDRETDAGGRKTVPILFNDQDNCGTDSQIDIGSNIEVLINLS